MENKNDIKTNQFNQKTNSIDEANAQLNQSEANAEQVMT